METSLIAKLGLNSTEYHAKLKGAEDGLKSFEGGVGDLAKVFSGAGVLTAIGAFFSTIITAARESEDQLDINVQAVTRFGEAFDNLKEGAVSLGINTLGTLNRVGEKFGELFNNAKAFFTGTTAEYIEAERTLERTAKAAAEAAANLAEARKHEGEFLAITASLQRLEEKRSAMAFDRLTTQEQINQLANEQARAEAAAADYTLTALERRQALLDARTAELELAKVQAKHSANTAKANAAVIKQFEADTKAQLAAEQKLAADRAKTAELLAGFAAEDARAAREKLPLEQQILELTKMRDSFARTTLSTTISEEEKRAAIISLRQTENDLAAKKLALEQHITTEVQDQHDQVVKTVSLLDGSAKGGKSTLAAFGRQTFNNAGDQRAYENQLRASAADDIEAAITRITDRIGLLQRSNSAGARYELPGLRQQVTALRNRRTHLDDYLFDPTYQDSLGLGRVGERAEFYGDPGATGRLEEQTKKQTDTLSEIRTTLRALTTAG